ncbi:response regulator transcription factor [Dyadobacter sp. LHD-138]|uniref:response regulator transcription factor n=1 Tax=Dyadobacter sp. LHD-138 TaxID=3071413 RepID=UPI0027E1DA8C|nr:response regulator transcription factor [Dyadobacter sp. LHD-138]MDQ6478066.1 response regulator transcription factor [Dyadobacter sp. LHD-138]
MKVIVVDQFPIQRNGLVRFLNDHFPGATIHEWDQVDRLFDVPMLTSVGLIVIGLSHHYPINTSKALKNIKRLHKSAKIILYDDKPEAEAVIYFMQKGVDGYLTKTTSREDLLQYFLDILQGNRRIGLDIMEIIFSGWHLFREEQPKSKQLTAHEYEIAKYLSEGMKTSRIAYLLDRKASTISTIKSTIFRKLDIDNVMKLRDRMGSMQGL